MAGEGHMSQVGSTLRENRKNMLDRKRLFKNKQTCTRNNTSLKFGKVSEKDLKKIKENIRIKAKRDKERFNLIMILTAIVVAVIFYYLFSDFSIDFKMFTRQR
ncbi:hypothetical protein [Tenacibaculum sp.]|uniref:hypothetical protein n=1 Tax=Tenacibaculum sp. TaxID=1906242 RepID=UPI003D0C9301